VEGLVNISLLKKHPVVSAAGILVLVVMLAWVVAYEPVTRNLIASDGLCNYCHLPWEFNADERLTATRPHPVASKEQEQEQERQAQARCVECHLPEGWWNSTYAYTHFLSITDLFGHFRDRDGERAGDWIPPRAATAYRVHDRLFEYDSNTCRGCHIEDEIKPKRARGVNAHKLAKDEDKTCIECHTSLVHRYVEPRKDAFKKADVSDAPKG
jgi:nitrate/TMAO reductase-like tetraheme cytochrome c subunit